MPKFKATQTRQGEDTFLHLEGILDGSIDFQALVGDPRPARLIVDCSRVLHANSSVVRPWKECFERLVAQGTELRFSGCTTPVIEYMNFVKGFRCGGTVISVDAPFYCKNCKRSFSATLDTRDTASVRAQIAAQKCATCFGPAAFDENADEFFSFMS